MRVADPSQDNGAFNLVKRDDALIWLKLLGAQGLSESLQSSQPRMPVEGLSMPSLTFKGRFKFS